MAHGAGGRLSERLLDSGRVLVGLIHDEPPVNDQENTAARMLAPERPGVHGYIEHCRFAEPGRYVNERGPALVQHPAQQRLLPRERLPAVDRLEKGGEMLFGQADHRLRDTRHHHATSTGCSTPAT